jgi:hypothetical protein
MFQGESYRKGEANFLLKKLQQIYTMLAREAIDSQRAFE